MAVVWMCGFESGANAQSYVDSGWTVNVTSNMWVSGSVPQPVGGAGGGRYAMAGNTTYFRYIGPGPNSKNPIGGPYPEFVFHSHFKRTGAAGNYGGMRLFSAEGNSAATQLVNLIWAQDNVSAPNLALYINGSLEATSTNTFHSTGWQRLVITADGVNGNYVVYIDGVAEITVTGGTTFSVAAGIDRILFGAGNRSGGTGFVDNAVLFDDISADTATALGDIYIQGLRPNGDDTDGSWVRSDNGTNVDLYQMVDYGTADYIETSTNPDEFRVTVEDRADIDPLWTPSAVHAVQAVNIATGAGSITQAEAKLEIASTTYTGTAAATSAADNHFWHLEEWPGSASIADLDTLKVGLKVS